jgi:hypothetical protein
MTLVEYLGNNAGTQIWHSPFTNARYEFGGKKKIGFVDNRDVEWITTKFWDGDKRLFRVAPEQPGVAEAIVNPAEAKSVNQIVGTGTKTETAGNEDDPGDEQPSAETELTPPAEEPDKGALIEGEGETAVGETEQPATETITAPPADAAAGEPGVEAIEEPVEVEDPLAPEAVPQPPPFDPKSMSIPDLKKQLGDHPYSVAELQTLLAAENVDSPRSGAISALEAAKAAAGG